MNTPYVFRKCRKCGEILLLTTDNFRKSTDKRDGKTRYRHDCRECEKKYRDKYNKTDNAKKSLEKYKNSEKGKATRKAYEESGRGKATRKAYEESEHGKAVRKAYEESEHGKKIRREYSKSENRKKYEQSEQRKNSRRQYEESKEGRKVRKEYRESEHGKQVVREYYASEQGQTMAFNRRSRRREKLNNQGKGITPDQWKEMMEYFNWSCGYSGIVFYDSKNKNRTIDHIVPVNKGGRNEIWNLVPMHKPYNSSKKDNDSLTWYKSQDYFSEERLAKIVEWQQYAYDKWATKEDDELILITDLK